MTGQSTLAKPRRVVNRLNDLDGRRWLPFQKSWFHDHPAVYKEFISFFTKRLRPDDTPSVVLTLAGAADHTVAAAAARVGRQAVVWDADRPTPPPPADYVLVDLRGRLPTLPALRTFLQRTAPFWSALGRSDVLRERCYATVLIGNTQQDGLLVPVAWQFARYLAGLLSLKDEKIGCISTAEPLAGQRHTPYFETDGHVYYALNFRREAARGHRPQTTAHWPRATGHGPRATGHRPLARAGRGRPGPRLRSWFVPRPPPREPGVLLHPAKYPETLVAEFVERCTQPGELVLDPMAGTGSTLLACLQTGRRGVGVELNPEYAVIARRRLAASGERDGKLSTHHSALATQSVVVGDALRLAAVEGLPAQVDYCITSPPYWDMLNMRGALTQRVRRQRGLHVSYGDDPRDVGNVAEYGQFVDALVRVYRQVAGRLRPGGYLTVIVKNVKKQGTIYPLAWDLAAALADLLQVCPERFWCQDDVKLAPYGYGNAWVSNTVHHYCLTFRKA